MKKFTLKTTMVLICSVLALSSQAQNTDLKSNLKPKSGTPTLTNQKKLVIDPNAPQTIPSAQKQAALTNCTDKIDYSGNTIGPYVAIGSNTNSSSNWEIGVFQVYPAYTGEVVGVEITGEKFNAAGNPKVYVGVFDLIGSMPDVSSQNPLPAPFITLSNTSSQALNITFSSPVQVTNGFAVGVYCLGMDSAKIHTGPVLPSVAPYYSYVYNSQGNMYSFYQYFNVDADLLIKPIVKTSVNPTWLTAKTSTGCGIPAVFNFTNTSGASPSWVGNTIINPSGVTRDLDYGDGSSVVNNFSGVKTHSYTTLGTFTASYQETYVGWTNNCVESQTLLVTVDNPQPSFTFTVNGLTVNFNNTSQNMSSFNWNFGDLSTSTQTDPSHTFSSPGTYVVELEGTAPCGTVKYTQSVIVTSNVGIKENGNISQLISLFPNPAANVLHIKATGSNDLNSKVEIYNSIGSSIKSVNTTGLNSGAADIDISDLAKGVYFIKLKHKEGDVVKSFVKE